MAADWASMIGVAAQPQKWGKGHEKYLDYLGKAWAKNQVAIQKETAKAASKSFTKRFAVGMKTKVMKKVVSELATIGLNTVGIFLQLMDALGVLEPILKLITGVLSIIGGTIMEVLAPAIQKFAEVLFSPEMMGIWEKLGTAIGTFIGLILTSIGDLLSDPEFQTLLKNFITAINNVFIVIGSIFKGILDWLSTLNPQQIGLLFYALAIGIAFLVGVMTGGPLGIILGAAYAVIAAIALLPLLALAEGGIVTRPTLALIGERGPEAVIPLDNEGGFSGVGSSDQSLLYATEDNGDKLDKLIKIMSLREGII